MKNLVKSLDDDFRFSYNEMVIMGDNAKKKENQYRRKYHEKNLSTQKETEK